MQLTPFIPFLTLLEKEMPFYVSTIGEENSHLPVYRPYGINDCQILYVTSGKGEAVIYNTTYELKKHSILYLPSNTPHHYYPTTTAWGTKYITFGGSGTHDFTNMPAFVQANSTEFDFSRWYKILYQYKYTPNHEKSLSVTLYATLLEFKSSISLSSPLSEAKKNMLISAMHEMATNFKLNLSDVAQKLNISEEHFCRTFKAYTGLRPLEYVNYLKIQRAKELLKSTDKNISEIAEMTGYFSPSYFTMIFKRYTGISPKNFRNS